MYDDKLFKAEKEIVKQSDYYIFGGAFRLLDRYADVLARVQASRFPQGGKCEQDLLRAFNLATLIVKNIYEKYLAFVDKIDSSSGAKIDNITNQEIFDKRLESLEMLQAVSGYGVKIEISHITDLRSYPEVVKTFPGMKKLVGIFADGITEMCKSMHGLTPPTYSKDEMFPKGDNKTQTQESSQKGPKASK